MSGTDTTQRTYRGTAMEERRAKRRCQLVAAAIKVYGERGYRQSSVKAVCEAAGLTERYFYESFSNSEALLAACLGAVTEHLFGELARVGKQPYSSLKERTRAMLLVYFAALRANPQSARVFLLEIRGVSAEVDQAFAAALRGFGSGLACVVSQQIAPANGLLHAGVVGGIMHIAMQWLDEGFLAPDSMVVDAAWSLCSTLVHPE